MSDFQFKTREVRDLAWACFSPTLLNSENLADDGQNIANCGLALSPRRQQWLQALDKQPAALHAHLKQLHSTRLGLYFESLWHFFLNEDPAVELIAHNLPIRHLGQTLGEFDCLYYCQERQRHIHLELAVKYYLSCRQTTSTQTASHWNEWLGPTNTDHLDRKINHLTQRQIQLGDVPAARESLDKLGITTLAKEIEIKGYLFQSLRDPLPAPHAHNPQNKLCRWLSISELPQDLEADKNRLFLVLPKSHWLAPVTLDSANGEPLNPVHLNSLLSKHFTHRGRAQLVASFDDTGREARRFFVVGESWPGDSGKPGKPPTTL